jgi:transaldolase
MEYAIERGAVGATTNPVIVGEVLKRELPQWKERIFELIQKEMPSAGEEEIAWQIIEEMAVRGAKMLLPTFEKYNGQKGRISVQTNAKYYRNAEKMVSQAVHLSSLAPNIHIKMPASAAGIKAFEEATYAGVSINATVSFSVPQAIAVAEAVERGLKRREAEGLPTDTMAPICTIMVGRTDDWVKEAVARDNVVINPDYLEWCGVAVMKKAYRLFQERGYRTRLLNAAYRNHYHWSQFIGGDISMTITNQWQCRINGSDIDVVKTIDRPVDPAIIDSLLKIPDFVMAYQEDGLKPEEFEHYGAFVRTITTFLKGYDELLVLIRGFMIGEPLRK